ncbi:MAG: hypothetical protein K0Q59_3468 [Paenibacillus sp.]|jgi:hypothetical protein|nr:hypothetical protein [Paenibacillus sp.]
MELVGQCRECGKDVYCKGGFLDGVTQNGKLYCHSCYEEQEREQQSEGGHPEQK